MTESANAAPVYAGPKRVFSGVQPTNGLHLGNYLGALKNFVALQNEFDCLYCVVDLHAITAKLDPENLARNTREAAAAFIASGVDPKRSAVFAQSAVVQHAELAWTRARGDKAARRCHLTHKIDHAAAGQPHVGGGGKRGIVEHAHLFGRQLVKNRHVGSGAIIASRLRSARQKSYKVTGARLRV